MSEEYKPSCVICKYYKHGVNIVENGVIHEGFCTKEESPIGAVNPSDSCNDFEVESGE